MSSRGLLRVTLFSFLVWVVAASLAWAQLPTSTLNGIVTDPQGAAVAGAKVTVTSKATGLTRDVSTGSEGQYVIANLLPGDYDIRIETQGFATREFKGVRLEVGRVTTLDVKLALGQLGQQVTVSEAVAQVDLTQSTVQGQISATTVENIPLNGRNYLELAFLVPGNRPATNFDPTKTNTLEVSSAGAFGRGGHICHRSRDHHRRVEGGRLADFPADGVAQCQNAPNQMSSEVGLPGRGT